MATVYRWGRLTIGAPSSPAISNAIMYEFDEFWHAESRRRGCAYSRYAGDLYGTRSLYFSTDRPNTLAPILVDLREYIKSMKTPNLRINEEKMIFSSRKRRRLVTGLILTPGGEVSVGRKKKRHIRSMLYDAKRGELEPGDASYLSGSLAWSASTVARRVTESAIIVPLPAVAGFRS